MAGTPTYISPEIFISMSYTTKGDIWACGILLFVLLLGSTPYHSMDTKEIQSIVSRGQYDFFNNDKWDDVTSQAKDLVAKLLSYEPSQRFTAREALRHPWISKRDTIPSKLHRSQTIEELKEYNKEGRKWRTLGHAVILTARFKKLMRSNPGHTSIAEVIEDVPVTDRTMDKVNVPKKMLVEHSEGNLNHHEEKFIIDVIAITQSIVEAMQYNNTELYNQLIAPNSTETIITKSPQYQGQRVTITNPLVHMIGMDGACVSYTKNIIFVDAESKFETVSIPETRVWKNFSGKWKCVHYHS